MGRVFVEEDEEEDLADVDDLKEAYASSEGELDLAVLSRWLGPL